MDTTQTITHVSLCAGYGGIDLGLGRAIPNLRTIAFSEIEAFACANLVSKMEAGLLDAAPIWTNLKTFPWAEFRDRVDILSGGYPCQPFSAAGKRLGTEDPRHLWPFIADGIRAMRPKLCFFENVEGHISLGLREVISELESIGYKAAWGIFSAREVGAPHQRKRVFILAYRNREGSQRAICEGIQRASRKPFGHNDDVLAYSNNGRGGEDKLLSELRATGIEQSSRCTRLPSESIQVGKITIWSSRPGELANAERDGRRASTGDAGTMGTAQCSQEGGEPQPRTITSSAHSGCDGQAWPSRPGEQQFAWEPPRVVANSPGKRAGQRSELCGEECGSRSALSWNSQQSGEGRGLPNAQNMRLEEQSKCGQQHQADGSRPSNLSGVCPCEAQEGRSVEYAPDSSNGQQPTEQQGRDTSGRSSEEGNGVWQAEPSLGRDADGFTNRLDDAELYTTCDNRTDELRLLGNGVVPATAERAFRTLLTELL